MRQMASPNPVPSALVETNTLNTFPNCAGSIPGPESCTDTTISSRPRTSVLTSNPRLRLVVIDIASTALLIRLKQPPAVGSHCRRPAAVPSLARGGSPRSEHSALLARILLHLGQSRSHRSDFVPGRAYRTGPECRRTLPKHDARAFLSYSEPPVLFHDQVASFQDTSLLSPRPSRWLTGLPCPVSNRSRNHLSVQQLIIPFALQHSVRAS